MNSLIKRKVFILMFVLLLLPLLVGCFLLPPQNQDPIITSVPVTDATVGQAYTYNVEATDPDRDPLTYALPVAPDGMEISAVGILSWTPGATGTYEVTVEVSDGKTSITQTFTIVVNEQSSTPSTSPPSTVNIEDEAKNILETQDNGREYFEQLAVQGDPDALQKTLDFLKTQPNVDDAEIGADNVTIWVFYKSGVEGIIFTEPYRVTCGLPKSGTYRSNLATITRETTLTDKKAVIISPFFNSYSDVTDSLDEITVYLQQSGYSLTNIERCDDENVTVNFMQTLSDYDFIYMFTHGSARPTYQDATILTGEQATYSLMYYLWSYLTNNKIQVGTVEDVDYFALSSKFFADYTYPGSIVHVDACLTLQNDAMANVFLNHGAKVYLGWTEKSYTNLCSIYSPKIYQELAKPNKTLQQAYNDTYANDFPISIYKDTNENGWPGMICADGKQLGDPSEGVFDYTLDFEFRGDSQFVLNSPSVPETYTITASAGANGSISPSGEISVNHGSDQSFTITPNMGYIVEDVMVDGTSVGAVDTYTFTNITQNHTISATFSTIETTVDVPYALTVNHALPLQEGILYERWIQLQWENYPEAIGYNIYRSVNQEEYLLIDQTLETAFPGFSDSDVSIGNSYDYYITAYGTNWETAPSEIKHLDTWLPCPYLISPVDNSTIADPNPTFTWDPVGISNFPYGNIYSGSSAFFVHQNIAEDSIDICRIDFPDLITSNATYYQDENAYPLIPENNYFFNTLAWGFDSSGSLIAKSCSHVWEFYYEGDGEDYLIEFEDPKLEQVVRETINKPEGTLYLSDVIGITTLNANERGIISLEGIQHLENLQYLDVFDNQVSDISALANLTNLQRLSFYHNQVSDISALANLTNLQRLWFLTNQVSDISALANLTNLQRLGFSDNQVSDISALSNLTNLGQLSFYFNQVLDISSLQNLTNLQWLEFNDNQVSDISALVSNSGFGPGDTINMMNNYLDLTEGSQNRQDIETLISRGVSIRYTPQLTP